MRNTFFVPAGSVAAGKLMFGLAIAILVPPDAASASRYFCGHRELTPAETAGATRVIESLRKTLPAAPAGWTIRADDTAVDCGDVPRPVPADMLVTRSYLHTGGSAQAGSVQDDQARVAEIERRLAALRAEEQEIASKLTAARATRDPKAMQPLQEKIRDLRQRQVATSRELSTARADAQRKVQERKNAEWVAAQKPENTASVHVTTNHTSFAHIYPKGKRISVPGVPLAIQDPRGDGLLVTQLYFGSKVPSAPTGQQVVQVAIDPSAPITEVQNLVVRINAWPDATEQLLKGIDVAALKGLVKP